MTALRLCLIAAVASTFGAPCLAAAAPESDQWSVVSRDAATARPQSAEEFLDEHRETVARPTAEEFFEPPAARPTSEKAFDPEPARQDPPAKPSSVWGRLLAGVVTIAAWAVALAAILWVLRRKDRVGQWLEVAVHRLPSRRTTLIVAATVAASGLLALDPYPRTWPVLTAVLTGKISFGEWALPYRSVLLACVLALSARWLLPAGQASTTDADVAKRLGRG